MMWCSWMKGYVRSCCEDLAKELLEAMYEVEDDVSGDKIKERLVSALMTFVRLIFEDGEGEY